MAPTPKTIMSMTKEPLTHYGWQASERIATTLCEVTLRATPANRTQGRVTCVKCLAVDETIPGTFRA